MKVSLRPAAFALALLSFATPALAGGDSVPVYTGYDQPVHVAPYTPPPTIVVTRKREASIVVVPAVIYQDCCCCCSNTALAMSVAAGGQVIYN